MRGTNHNHGRAASAGHILAVLVTAVLAACVPAPAPVTPLAPAQTHPAATLPVTSTPARTPTAAPRETPDFGWQRIEPGGETQCAHGDPFMFWAHEGPSDNLLIYLGGGGGCWDADTCRDDGLVFNGYYKSRITPGDMPIGRSGILDLDNPENPFAAYDIVAIPVCTGDVHWGSRTHTYRDPDGDVTIHFYGFINTSAALAWTYEHFAQPESVFLTGCSAGSAGSLLHAPYVIEAYPDTPVVQFGDSLALIMDGPVDLQSDWGAHDSFAPWIPALQAIEPQGWSMARMMIATANYYPDTRFSEFNSIRDHVQVRYTFPDGSGDPYRWADMLDAHLNAIQAAAPNHRSYTPGGTLHCINPSDEFYRYAIDGVRVRDWVAALAAGQDVPSLHCKECELPELAPLR